VKITTIGERRVDGMVDANVDEYYQRPSLSHNRGKPAYTHTEHTRLALSPYWATPSGAEGEEVSETNESTRSGGRGEEAVYGYYYGTERCPTLL
jgi:hypothetical protein